MGKGNEMHNEIMSEDRKKGSLIQKELTEVSEMAESKRKHNYKEKKKQLHRCPLISILMHTVKKLGLFKASEANGFQNIQ